MSLFDTNTQADATIDSTSFREALGHFACGITIITTQVDDEPIGFTYQSFYNFPTCTSARV